MRLRRTGHILGAASVQLDWAGITTVFSGDLGRYDDPIMVDPVLGRARRLSAGRIDLRRPAAFQSRSGRGPGGDRWKYRRPRWNGRHPGLCRRAGAKPDVSFPPIEIEGIAVERPHLPRQSNGRRRQRGLLQQRRKPQAPGGRVPAFLCRRALHPQRRGIEGAHRQSRAEGDHLRKRNGDRRTRAASSQALCSGPQEHHSVRRLSGRRNARRRHDGGRGKRQDPRRIRAGSRAGEQSRHSVRPCRCGRNPALAAAASRRRPE